MRPMLLAVLVAVALPAAKCRETVSGTPPTKDRVLKEAASTYRYARAFFLVNQTAYPYRVTDAFATRDSATRVAAASGGQLEVSGPYEVPRAASPWDILSVTVRFRTADGREQTVQYDPKSVDAVFLTRQAVDKFMIPYYTKLYGPAFADSLGREMMGKVPPPPPPCHRYSFPCIDAGGVKPQPIDSTRPPKP
jgi:hypothetical protein